MEVAVEKLLSGKRVVVTGAARGIGRATALAAAQAGARVYAVDVLADELDALGAELGDGHAVRAFDLRRLGELDQLCSDAHAFLGPIDGLAHVAGVIVRRHDIYDVSEEDWDLQVDVNLKSTFFLIRSIAPYMSDPSSIVNYSSIAWWTGGNRGSMVYSATKAGVIALTRGFARTLAPRGIRVNAIAPGVVETDMITGGMSIEDEAEYTRQIPLGRMAAPEELAKATVFLLSDMASYIAAATINVSGGRLLY